MDDVDQKPFGLENISNFRDVGKTVNAFLDKRLVREGLLYRSARPDDANVEEQALLKGDLGIRSVMDLRTRTEHINASKKRHGNVSNSALAVPPQIPDLRYLEIRLGARSVQMWMLWQLSWWHIFLVLFFYAVGLRMQAIGIMAREVMAPRGLTGLAIVMLDHSMSDINKALSSLLKPGALPMLVHCTQGKDRTGLVILLVLMILGVPLDAIDFDYRLTDKAILRQEGVGLDEMRTVGLPDEFRRTAPDLTQKVHQHLRDLYGGIDGYLDTIGFDKGKRDHLRELMLY